MNQKQNFNDFDIESSFQEDDSDNISKPLIPAKPPKAISPTPARSSFKAPSGLSREDQLLSTVVHLDNGTTGYLITLNKSTGTWTCHACYPIKIPTMSLLEDHLISKSHLLEMGKSCFPAKNFVKACPMTGLSVGVPSMISGEPIPPGMEDEVENVLARIQATLDSIFIPLIGLEFVLELLPSESKEEPRYMCALCDKRGDPRTFPNHLRSFNHHMAYLRRYFRSLASALEQLTKVSSKGFQELVFHVIGKIEEEYGRMKPIVVDASLFEIPTEKIKILRQVNNGKHIVESPEDRWMLEMITTEYLEDPKMLQEKFPLKKIAEKNKREQEEKQKALKAETTFNKNPRIAVNKSQLRSKNDKEDSDSDVEFVDIKHNTEARPRPHVPSRDSRDRRHGRRSPSRKNYRSRSPYRHKSRSRSKTPIMTRPRSRSRSRSPKRSRTRSRSPYYNRNKYSSHRRRYRSRERDESYKRQISPPSVHPMHSMSGYVPGHPHPRMFYAGPYMPFPRPFMRYPPPGRPRFYSPDMYSSEYQPQKERSMSKRKRLQQEFEKAVEEMKIEMKKKLSHHEKNPENHPSYPDEWKKFWNRRFKELQIEGKDPNTYDFKPEWILSWSKRLQEFHEEEVNEKIEKLRNKILGDVNMNKSSSESPPRDYSPSKDKRPITDFKNARPSVMSKNYGVSEGLGRNSEKFTKVSNDKKPKVAGASPIVSDSEDSTEEINDQNKPREKIKIDNPLNVITVLRQLSVLEDQLGLLAPKIVDLLSKGLTMEKIEPKTSINLLTPENCVMFETVKEKLKGQLLAGVVKKNLVNATMFSVRNIEKLMQRAPKFVPTTSMLDSTFKPTPTPVAVPGIGVVDKMAIAQHITQALLAQGKVDVTQEELETLINAVVGMAQSNDNIQGAKNLLSNINNAKDGDVLKSAFDEINKKGKKEAEKKKLDQLSQGDIINLLKNFKDLTLEEQDGLITYLKDLWKKNPDEIKKFRKYIEMGPFSLKEVTALFKDEKDDDDDDNYELVDVINSVNEKVQEQNEDLNTLAVDFEITEEQKKLLSSIQNFLPQIKSDYGLNSTNSETQVTADQPFFQSTNNETCSSSYSSDPYSAQKTDVSVFPPQPSTSTPYLNAQEPPNNYNLSREHLNEYNILEDQSNKYKTLVEQPNEYSTLEEQPDKYHIPEEQSDPYSANQVDTYNDPYSQNHNSNYYQGQRDSYYQYQQTTSTSTYPSSGNYYKNKNSYKGNNTYPDTYQGAPKENEKKNRYGRSNNNRFQNRHN